MLQHMRDNSKGVISGILIGILVIAFALTGADALFQWDASANKAVVVNGETVTDADVVRGIANRKQQIINQYGESVPAEYLTDEKLRAPVIDGLIQKTLLSQAAVKGGLAANTEKLMKEIVSAPVFHKEGGVFDQEKYTQLLRYQGYTPTTYQKVLAEESMIQQLQTGLTASAFVTAAELKHILGLSFQTRDFSYVVLSAEKADKSVTVGDGDIKTYYEANPQAFTTAEQVAVDYIELSTAELAKNIVVTDDQIKKQFDQNMTIFAAKTERQAAHILVTAKDQKQAETIKEKLAAGEDFAKLAKEFSTDTGSKEQGGDLGFTTGDTFPAEFEAALAKLKVGEVSAPVKTDAGIHIIKLLAERATKPPSFEEAKAGIVDDLKKSEAESQFAAKLEKLRDLSYNADQLADVAKDIGLTAKNSGLFAKVGGKDITANTTFINAAFSAEVLEQGNASEVIELESNRVVVLKKTDRKPSQLQPIEAVKDQIVQLVRTEKTQALLLQQSNDLIAGINAGKTIETQAKTLGLELKVAKNVSRSTDKDTDREILKYAFSLPAPATNAISSGSAQLSKGDRAVVVVAAVTLAAEESVPVEQRKSIATQLTNIHGANDMKNYVAHLQEVAKIKRQ